MQIPSIKVLIYVLTFIGYAYSGVGSDILSNLRDAVVMAESVFGDVLKNIAKVAQKVKNVHEVFDAAVEEHCHFKCPIQGITPKPKYNHVPTSDGCGSLGLHIKSENLPFGEMTKCCDAHDLCYDTCNSDKELCDVDFKRCLYRYCDNHSNLIGERMVKTCKGAAKMLFTGTLTLGCKSYLDAQRNACFCAGYEKKDSKNKKYARGNGEL